MSHSPWTAMRSLTRDGEVAKKKLAPGTIPRIAQFARPYKRQISLFLVLVVLDAMLIVALPLLFKVIIDEGVLKDDKGVVVTVALVVAGIAVFDALLTLIQRLLSSQVGEGLIYDLRTQVFGHVQRMPVAFFTRTQTGALVSRLNTDVIGAQQAFTSTLSSVVSNVVGLVLVLTTMLILSWQVTLAALVLTPLFLLPARWVGRKLQAITREAMQLNAAMSTTMTERFNVSGALLVKLFGRLDDETPRSPTRPPGSATSASSRRCTAGSSSPASPSWPRSRRPWSTASAACSPSPARSGSARWWRSPRSSAGCTGR